MMMANKTAEDENYLQLQALLGHCTANDRVCPLPVEWNRIWKLIPEDDGREPKLLLIRPGPPLILAAWWYTTDEQKQGRLDLQLRWAFEMDVLDRVDHAIRQLQEDDWHHGGE